MHHHQVLHQSSSSSKFHEQKCPTSFAETSKLQRRKKKKKQQQQQSSTSRNPLRDLNNGACTNDNSSNASSLSSMEAPKGCLRFFLSHSSSSSTKSPINKDTSNGNNRIPIYAKPFSSKTPKSAPNLKPDKGKNSSKRTILHKPISQPLEKVKRKPPPCLYKWQSGKKSSSKNMPNSKILDSSGSLVNKLKSEEPRGLKQVVDGCDAPNLTPLSKVASGSGLNFAFDGEKSYADTKTNSTSSNNKTPPVQASVSPEIQYATSTISTAKTSTPACYAAGHVLSGVTDKRKRRPRGILTVGEAKALGSFESDDDTEQESSPKLVSNSRVPMLPLPTEASMHWLLSPCNEDNEYQAQNSDSHRLVESAVPNSPASPSSAKNDFWLGLCNNSNDRIACTSNGKRIVSLVSPGECFEFQGIIGSPSLDALAFSSSEQKRKSCYNPNGENSPFSIGSLGSENVIQTPQSNSSSDRQVSMSCLGADSSKRKHNFDPELDLVTENLHMASLSPESHTSIWDPTRSSFQFDHLITPSISVDLSRFQGFSDVQASWLSDSMMENVSVPQSQMRISWREGLVSRIFEMDEFDICRCLTDEEDNVNGCSNKSLKAHWSPELTVDGANKRRSPNIFGSIEFLIGKHGEKDKDGLPFLEPCSSAESISTDGGGLVRSDDSDWTLCYKNQLFQE